MEEMMNVLIEYATLWAPSLVSAFVSILAFIVVLSKSEKIVQIVSVFIEKHKESKEMKSLAAENRRLSGEVADLNKKLGMVLDKLAKIKDYSEKKK